MNVSRPDINSVLMQMREMQAQTQAPQTTGQINRPEGINEGLQGVSKTDSTDFGNILKGAVDSVNETQMQASQMAKAYEQGDPNVDLTQVMVGLQKASLSFQAMTQVRNRLVSAYEDIMNMPV